MNNSLNGISNPIKPPGLYLPSLRILQNGFSFNLKFPYKLFLCIIFIVLSILLVNSDSQVAIILPISIGLSAYMALNIGANDVANSVGPAVGSKAITLVGAVVIAGIFNLAGALIAGGDVASTIKKGVIDPSLIPNVDTFIYIMFSALLSGALWLNLATYFKAPVSTTHSIIGSLLGAGIAATGFGIVDWGVVGSIMISWITSPVIGGVIVAGLLLFIKKNILFKQNKIKAAKKILPYMISLMTGIFSIYLILKGLKKVISIDMYTTVGIGILIAIITFFVVKPIIASVSKKFKNNKLNTNKLFNIPLICSVSLLCFAHGANDVANAIGPLIAIKESVLNGAIASKASTSLSILLVGGAGIAIGLSMYGPRLIKTVGHEITHITQSRAFCIALSAAITVIIASQLGLPVSSTHIAIGGIFGVGFLREYLDKINNKKKKNLVERSALKKIILAWVLTVPSAGLISGAIFLIITSVF